MYLNTIQPGKGAKSTRRRVGRGIGSGLGKTCGRGHKGQHARAGGFHKLGFEGGQMPQQRRLPKFGFTSHKAMVTVEIRLNDLNKIEGKEANLVTLRKANLINSAVKYVKIIASGELKKSLHIKDLAVTQGARSAIEAAGGKIEE